MKKIILSVAVIAALGLTSCKNETKQEKETTTKEVSKDIAMTELSFGVRGNCGMCKSTIETVLKVFLVRIGIKTKRK